MWRSVGVHLLDSRERTAQHGQGCASQRPAPASLMTATPANAEDAAAHAERFAEDRRTDTRSLSLKGDGSEQPAG
jgi:hypothetical protein